MVSASVLEAFACIGYDILRIFADLRWIGEHGIGRFAKMLAERIPLVGLPLAGAPTDPLDALRLSFNLPPARQGGIFFSPGYNAPLFSSRPFVFCLHDLNHIDRTENSSVLKRLYYRIVLRRACHRAAYVLTVSEFSRARIIAWSGIPGDRVINVGNGVDATFCPADMPEPGAARYLLSVSNRKHHKNEMRIVEAFARAEVAADIQLLFTGNPTAELLAHIALHGVSARVAFAGRVPESDFPALYRGAMALIFPSLYEGFGLPVIEAMACGTVVLTSDTTSLPEVAGGAALLVDPLSVEQIAQGMARLCSDTDLRAALRAKGLLQAAKFTWDETARKVADVLQQIDRR